MLQRADSDGSELAAPYSLRTKVDGRTTRRVALGLSVRVVASASAAPLHTLALDEKEAWGKLRGRVSGVL
jgi:hypothetical protein